jgi:hypothetical protein
VTDRRAVDAVVETRRRVSPGQAVGVALSGLALVLPDDSRLAAPDVH